jgi:hypothetical protein
MTDINTQVEKLVLKSNLFSSSHGAKVVEETEKQTILLRYWLEYLINHHKTGVADSLLTATQSLIRECAANLSMGMVRSALFSLRGQIDLSLAWLYFKDHAIEWRLVNTKGDGFKLKKEILEYLTSHNPGFSHRIGILKQIHQRQEAEPYRLLSAHIHGQSEVVLPSVPSLSDVVYNLDSSIECTKVAFEVSEYINDIFLSVFRPQWYSLPPIIQSTLDLRFSSQNQKAEFFKLDFDIRTQ